MRCQVRLPTARRITAARSVVLVRAPCVWARTIAVIIATVSAIANFAFLPYQPFWALTVIVIDVFVIWALTVHGRDIAEPRS